MVLCFSLPSGDERYRQVDCLKPNDARYRRAAVYRASEYTRRLGDVGLRDPQPLECKGRTKAICHSVSHEKRN